MNYTSIVVNVYFIVYIYIFFTSITILKECYITLHLNIELAHISCVMGITLKFDTQDYIYLF